MKKISVLQAKPNMILSRDICRNDGSLLLSKGTILDQNLIQRLIKLGIRSLFINIDIESQDIHEKSTAKSVDIISSRTRQEAENLVEEVMEDVKSGKLIETEKVKKVVERIIFELLGRNKIIAKLADIRFLDNYTFTHCVNVCVISISTGIINGYNNAQLKELGISALLHDIGKVYVPKEILNKPSSLTDEEFHVIRKHTEKGYECLQKNTGICSVASIVALEHHEHYDGGGYPRRIKRHDIHEYSQIVALADVYDALTSNRVYRNANKPYEAVEIIISSAGNQFNPQLVKLFVQNLAVYPIGCVVQLNDGSICTVESIHKEIPIRPKLRVLFDALGREVKGIQEIDMLTRPTIFIENIIKFDQTSFTEAL